MNGRKTEGRRQKAEGRRQLAERFSILAAACSKISASFSRLGVLIPLAAFCLLPSVYAQSVYEERRIENVAVAFEGNDRAVSVAQQFELTIRSILGEKYSAVKVRDALDALYKTRRVVSVKVEATPVDATGVNLRFFIKRKTEAEKIVINVGNTVGDKVTEQELLLKLNLTNAGSSVTENSARQRRSDLGLFARAAGFTIPKLHTRKYP